MINILDPKDCCGCTACVSICAHHAISMVPDELGFLYPIVNESLCIDCGLCEKVCAFSDDYDKSLCLPEPLPYGARHKNIEEIETSRSGAVFIALSDYILDNGGVVYGAGFTDHFRVVHKRATTKEERNEFKGSKYVQSDLRGVFPQVKQDLRSGLMVLFSGTPCQCAGLNSYVGKKLRQNLFIVDIVCHGVPSPYIWSDYLKYQERKVGLKITEVNFRDKLKFGWNTHKESLVFNNIHKSFGSFSYLFSKNIMFRHSCQVCHYTNLKRTGDITIADFWGWQKTDENFNKDNMGCSLIFVNTEKGVEWFDRIKNDLILIYPQIENCMQPNLQNPSVINPKRNAFEKDYVKHGFDFVIKKYGDQGLKYKVERVNLNIKRVIYKVLNFIR